MDHYIIIYGMGKLFLKFKIPNASLDHLWKQAFLRIAASSLLCELVFIHLHENLLLFSILAHFDLFVAFNNLTTPAF